MKKAFSSSATDATEEGLQKILQQLGKTLPLKTAFSLDTSVSDGLKYFRSYEYTHPNVKPSSLLHVYSTGNENEIFLVGYVVLHVPTGQAKYKESEQAFTKAHDGTIDFASRVVCTGAHPRRGAIELLGYNLLQWLCCRLHREDNLKNPKYITQQKSRLIENIRHLMSKCFLHENIPCSMRAPEVRYHANCRPTTQLTAKVVL
ncbi:hypothetical protein MRX96_017034 [Rhipicephalus microplus]|uniref:Uncharacterized protein n=1 Tax=Rhipicephalus microplus TaxID=6941 RepID=A0A9J6EHD6_RHIMP|nr:serine/threonine-protein kinase VRK1-like [Rhipicephalus microplus]KAH8033647.1 hypothetical protein HPB51_014928 [Rhipicephalus microplus]